MAGYCTKCCGSRIARSRIRYKIRGPGNAWEETLSIAKYGLYRGHIFQRRPVMSSNRNLYCVLLNQNHYWHYLTRLRIIHVNFFEKLHLEGERFSKMETLKTKAGRLEAKRELGNEYIK